MKKGRWENDSSDEEADLSSIHSADSPPYRRLKQSRQMGVDAAAAKPEVPPESHVAAGPSQPADAAMEAIFFTLLRLMLNSFFTHFTLISTHVDSCVLMSLRSPGNPRRSKRLQSLQRRLQAFLLVPGKTTPATRTFELMLNSF